MGQSELWPVFLLLFTGKQAQVRRQDFAPGFFSARPRERVPIGACIYLAVGDNDVWPSTTILSKSMSIFPSTIGSRGNISEGGYHGCFSTTPFWTAFATNFPISSPSKGTSFLSLSYL